jgi:hypothetical protein
MAGSTAPLATLTAASPARQRRDRRERQLPRRHHLAAPARQPGSLTDGVRDDHGSRSALPATTQRPSGQDRFARRSKTQARPRALSMGS